MAQINQNTIQWDSPPQPVGKPVTGSANEPLQGGVILPGKPEKPEKPTETFRMATASEKTAAGLDPARSYQISSVTGEFKDVGGQPTAKPAMEADPNRAFKINSTLDQLASLRSLAQKSLSVGEQAGRVRSTPVIGALLGQNRADLEGALAQVEGNLIQDQLAALAQINPGGIASLANSESEARRLASSIANLDPNQSQDQFLAGIGRAEEYYKRQLEQLGAKREAVAPTASGAAPAAGVAPIEAGKPIQTEQDLAAQRALQDAWNAGKSVDDIIAINQQFNRGSFAPEDVQRMRDARSQGESMSFYATPTGQPTAAQGIIGAALETPVGEAVGGYAMGAANALTAGTLDELAPILGLDPARVQAAKDYLRERAPVSSLAGEVTGGIIGAIPAVRGAGLALGGTRLAGAAPLLGEMGYGAAYGAGEAPTGDRLTGALIGGGAAGIGGALANRFLPGGTGTFTGMTPDVPAGAVVPEVPPVAAMAPEAPSAAAAMPSPAPVAPEVAPMAAAAPEVPVTADEMITLAQKAVSRAPGASKARAELAEIAKTNPEAKAAADRLGVELPIDVLSDNAQLKEVTGLTRAQIGSEAKQAWNETVQAASDRAHQAMDDLDAVTDISQVSADVFDRLDNAQKGLGRQASDLRQEVTDAVDVRGRVDATGIKSWLQTRIDDLGGGKEGIAALSPEEKRLWGIVSKGQPTYALLNEQRDLIGQALEKGTGPWSNTNMKRLKDIYGSLANDQINFIEASAGKEIADKQRAANTLFKQMYDSREQMERIFTKNLSGSLAPLMQRAITQGAKGNAQTLNTLVKIIPEDMRGKVLTSALFKAAKATDETFSFTNFANIYRDLRANGAIYKEFAKAVGPEGDKLMTDLYAISRRLSDADKAISRTGASTQLQLLNSERLLSRILMATGGAAGAGLIGSVLGGPGAAIVGAGLAAAAPEIAQRVGKTNAQKLHNLMSSTEFRELATSAATGESLDRNINRVAGSGAFREFAKNVGIELKQGRNWLRSAITAGGVQEMGPDAGPPEGAIMVKPQQ